MNEEEIDMDMSKMLSSKELDGSSESCFILQDVVKQRSGTFDMFTFQYLSERASENERCVYWKQIGNLFIHAQLT